MQLDKTAITISQRTGTELVDLSLIVLRRYWGLILLHSMLGIVPFALINLVLLWPLTQYDTLLMASREFASNDLFQFRYLCVMTCVILIEAPLALSGLTYFIGQAVFIERPTVRSVLKSVWQRIGAMLLIVGFLRMSVLVLIPMTFLFMDPVFRPEFEVPVYLLLMCGYVFLLRGFRPFATEILLLERCPLVKPKKRPDQLAYTLRSSSLHRSLSGELFGAHIGVSIVEFLTAGSLIMSTMFLIGVLTGTWRWGLWMDLILYPLIVWCIAIWGTLIRFLLYMNSRIRTEGWEIELRLKAEAQRMEPQP